MTSKKTKVAILGGGVAGLTAAYALSEIDPTGERFDITLYQLGWRLGGKCASGRNGDFGQRIEEHGLHIWAGFYENAFTVMRSALKALDRAPGSPQASIGDCFKRQNEIFLAEQHGGKWLPWPLWFAPNPDLTVFPGRDSIFSEPGAIAPPLGEILQRALSAFEFSHHFYADQWPHNPLQEAAHAIAGLASVLRPHVSSASAPAAAPAAHPLLSMAGHLLKEIGEGVIEGVGAAVHTVVSEGVSHLLGSYHGSVKALLEQGGLETEFRRYLIMADFGIRIIDGILRNDCLQQGLHVIDKYEFREFLSHGGPMKDNALVSSLYDYTFAYEAGENPRLSACSAVSGIIRLFMTYKGAFFWKATAGMGDTICTPIYQLLQKRGVKVAFFHQVMGLELTEDGNSIGTIHINQQVALADNVTSYDPFVTVDGLPSWPSQPNWSQLKDGAALKAAGVDFEDVLDPLPEPARKLPLKLGQDFDAVIMGMSLGSLPGTCAPLIARSPAWQAMTTKMGTTRTQALQLWLNTDLAGLGGPYVVPPQPPGTNPPPNPMGPILTNYQKPFDTWADMSHLLPMEDWSPPGPKSVAYFCSVFPDSGAPDQQAAANAAVLAGSSRWMTTQLGTLWPNIKSGNAFRWDMLYADAALHGEERLSQQFWQCNINPSERYVLSLPGTLQYRLESGASGFSNLYLAGDWTKVPDVNAGCVEVATMSGLMAAAALSGEAIPIAAPEWLYNRPFTSAAASHRPGFASYAGWEQLPPPPSTCNDATFYAWGLKADHDKCQAFIDRSLNSAKSRTRFRLLLDVAFLMVVKCENMFPATPPWADEGRMNETDMGFWLLVAAHEGDNPIPTGVGWMPAYLLVDNPYATASGREIWGFPKFVGQMSTPAEAQSSGPFTATATVIRKFAPASRAEPVELINVTGENIEFSGADGSAIDILHKLAHAGKRKMLAEAGALVASHGFLPKGAGEDIPVYFLKQFRTADSTTDACYQSQLKGALRLDALRGLGLLSGTWMLELADTDSLPFIRDLGLGTPANGKLTLTTNIGFWGDMDFTVAMAHPLP